MWNGEVAPGRHTLKAKVVYANGASVIVSDEGGHKWKVAGDVSFDVNSGIEVQVRVVPTRDPSQKDIAKRFRLALPARPVMVAALDDGKMPDAVVAKPPPPPPLPAPAAEPVDAGAPVVAEAPKPPPVKHGPTTDPVFEAGPPPPPKAEKPEKPLVVAEAKPAPAPVVQPAKEPVPASALDAGAMAAASIPVPPAGAAAPATTEEGSVPLLWLLAGLGLVAIIALVVVARRRAQPPKLDD